MKAQTQTVFVAFDILMSHPGWTGDFTNKKHAVLFMYYLLLSEAGL